MPVFVATWAKTKEAGKRHFSNTGNPRQRTILHNIMKKALLVGAPRRLVAFYLPGEQFGDVQFSSLKSFFLNRWQDG